MIKRFFLILLLAVSLTAAADEQSKTLLDKVRRTVNANTSYRIDFTATATGEQQGNISGQITVSGRRFALVASGMEVYYDGQTIWNFDKQKREVNVESLDEDYPNIMMNPTKMLAIDEQHYNHRMLAPGRVELIPKGSQENYSKIEVTVNTTTSLPEKIVITDKQSGELITITVSRFTPNVAVTIDTFRFNEAKNKGVDIIDFR